MPLRAALKTVRRLRPTRDVWLWYGNGWAVQFWPGWHISLGFHVDFKRVLDPNHPETEQTPLLDLHLVWLTVAVGPNAHITDQIERRRHSARGFLVLDHPML